MYILVENHDTSDPEKHVQYVLRNAHEEYIFDIFEYSATAVHHAFLDQRTFNIVGTDDSEVAPDVVMRVMRKLVRRLTKKGELVNLSDFTIPKKDKVNNSVRHNPTSD